MSTVKKLSPFDFLNSINMTKKDLMEDPDTEKQYVPFVVNRSLSYFPDTVAIANEMNKYHHLNAKLQYHFLINIIRKRKRFSKWIKSELENNIDKVKEYYGYSDAKARQILPLLSTDQLNIIINKVDKGGRK
ncbi:DNA polymerase clamp loader subunit A [bacterium]|nr:DNA polymerase clamp loader subunit A [bacterium]